MEMRGFMKFLNMFRRGLAMRRCGYFSGAFLWIFCCVDLPSILSCPICRFGLGWNVPVWRLWVCAGCVAALLAVRRWVQARTADGARGDRCGRAERGCADQV